MMNHQSGKDVSISLWESKEAMRTSEQMVKTLRDEIAGGLSTQTVDVDHFEVAIGLEEARG